MYVTSTLSKKRSLLTHCDPASLYFSQPHTKKTRLEISVLRKISGRRASGNSSTSSGSSLALVADGTVAAAGGGQKQSLLSNVTSATDVQRPALQPSGDKAEVEQPADEDSDEPMGFGDAVDEIKADEPAVGNAEQHAAHEPEPADVPAADTTAAADEPQTPAAAPTTSRLQRQKSELPDEADSVRPHPLQGLRDVDGAEIEDESLLSPEEKQRRCDEEVFEREWSQRQVGEERRKGL